MKNQQQQFSAVLLPPQFLVTSTWCDQIDSRLDLFYRNNNTYPLSNVVPFKAVSLGLSQSRNHATVLSIPCSTLFEPEQLHTIPQICLNHSDIIKSPSL